MQIGFARAFCDIHCVRDAVNRGDRSIVRNLELATKKTNNNMAALMKWSVEAAHTESGWLADKMDYSHVINVAYLQDIHNMLTGLTGPQGEGQLIERAAIATSKMFEEMQGYAEAAKKSQSCCAATQPESSSELVQELRNLFIFIFLPFKHGFGDECFDFSTRPYLGLLICSAQGMDQQLLATQNGLLKH